MSQKITPNITGKPGVHAMHLARKAGLKAFLAASGVVFFTFTAVLLLLTNKSSALHIIAAIGAVMGTIGTANLYRQATIEKSKAKVGAQAEKAVAKKLSKLQVGEVLHGTLLGTGGDADHIVLGPAAIVIETKAGRGIVKTQGPDFYVGRKQLPRNPIPQARNQARTLGQISGTWVQAIVCVPDMENETFTQDGVTICSLMDLPRVIAAAPQVINAFAAAALSQKLQGNQKVNYTPPENSKRPDPFYSKKAKLRTSKWRAHK